MLYDLAATYHGLTVGIERQLGSDKLAHVHAGMAIYLITRLLVGERRSSRHALQAVVTLAVLNEAADRLFWSSWRIGDTLGDLAATIFWPAMIFFTGRVQRSRWKARSPAAKTANQSRSAPLLARRSR